MDDVVIIYYNVSDGVEEDGVGGEVSCEFVGIGEEVVRVYGKIDNSVDVIIVVNVDKVRK